MRTHAKHITEEASLFECAKKNDGQTRFNSKIEFASKWKMQTKAHNTIHPIEQSIEKRNDETIIKSKQQPLECNAIHRPSVKNSLLKMKMALDEKMKTGTQHKIEHEIWSTCDISDQALNNEQQIKTSQCINR